VAKSYVEIIESYMSAVIYDLELQKRVPESMTLEKSQNVIGDIEMEDEIKMGYLREKYASSNK
jgi:hypothetical protein